MQIIIYKYKNIRPLLQPKALIVATCLELHELASNMFFSVVTAAVQRILANVSLEQP
jgi:hypothetical protein